MALFPSPLEVKIHQPATWYAGEIHTLELEVIARDELKVDFIEAWITADEGWSF